MDRTNSNAVTSLTLGILAVAIPYIGLITGIIGVVMSGRASKEISHSVEKGNGLAVAGIINPHTSQFIIS